MTCAFLSIFSPFFFPVYYVKAEPIITYDSIIQGKILSVEKNYLKLDNGVVRLCKNFDIHNARGRLISKENLKLALKIKAYIKKGCAQRIDILLASE